MERGHRAHLVTGNPLSMRSSRRSRPLRLLTVLASEEYGGAERYGVKVVAAAASQGWEVRTALRDLDATPLMRRELGLRGVPSVRMVDARRARGTLGFGALLLLYRPDVVHITAPWPLALTEVRVACAVMNVPTVVMNAVVPDFGQLEISTPRLLAWTRRRRQTWITFSRYGAAVLADAFSIDEPAEIRVIYNGVRTAAPTAPLTARCELRRRFGVDDDAVLIVDVARLSLEKGIDVLIDAVSQLVPRWPRLRVLIAGEGKGRTALEAQISRLGLAEHIRLLGMIDNVDALLSSADLFVFPSRREGNPHALLEAMSHGLPVVCAAFNGADEVITSPEIGLLVPKDDPDALARAIASSISDPEAARRRGVAGAAAVEDFSEERMFRETLTLLSEVAESNGTARRGDHAAFPDERRP